MASKKYLEFQLRGKQDFLIGFIVKKWTHVKKLEQ